MAAEIPHPGYPPGHPAFDGHFPGNPLVPGVLLLDAVVHASCEPGALARGQVCIDQVKFTGVVRPGQSLVIECPSPHAAGGRFRVLQGARLVAGGSLSPIRAADR